jgi:hypothetical protein
MIGKAVCVESFAFGNDPCAIPARVTAHGDAGARYTASAGLPSSMVW